jgi:hypothetical protein
MIAVLWWLRREENMRKTKTQISSRGCVVALFSEAAKRDQKNIIKKVMISLCFSCVLTVARSRRHHSAKQSKVKRWRREDGKKKKYQNGDE